MPRSLSERRRSNSTVVNNKIDKTTRQVAIHNITGLISCLIPAHICFGIVNWSKLAINITITTSSNEVIKANKAPEITPGNIRGMITLKKVLIGLAPKLCDALVIFVSNPTSVAVTVITTKGVASATWAKIIPVKVYTRLKRA